MISNQEDAFVGVRNLSKWFSIRKAFLQSGSQVYLKAVHNISFDIKEKETVGLVGESGCGKTTTGRLLLRLIEPQTGEISFDGVDLLALSKRRLRDLRRKIQIVFQDPYESLPPRMKILDLIAEPLLLHRMTNSRPKLREAVVRALESVQLAPPDTFLDRYPNELSGGQRQRVALARALVVQPKFLVADEPMSMLDVSIRAGVMNLMLDLKQTLGLTCLFITHDLSVARHMCDSLMIMYLGRILEKGPVEELIGEPFHPYSQALVAAVPIPDPEIRYHLEVIQTEVGSAINPPAGCVFHPRCRFANLTCRQQEPQMIEVGKNRFVACHLYSSDEFTSH